MKLRIARRAARELEQTRTFLEGENPAAASRIFRRIDQILLTLLEYPTMGRRGRLPETREMAVPGTPMLLVYRVSGDILQLVAVLHGRQDYP